MESIGQRYTWEQLADLERGTLLALAIGDGLALCIIRGGWSLCAYVGVPAGHPLWGNEADHLWSGDDRLPDVHGGYTFSGEFEAETYGRWGVGDRLNGWWWMGWDYGHSFDAMLLPAYEREATAQIPGFTDHHKDDVRWTVEAVLPEVEDAARHISQLALKGGSGGRTRQLGG